MAHKLLEDDGSGHRLKHRKTQDWQATEPDMNASEALRLARSILDGFKEAGQIYDEYKEEDQFTDEQYEAMLVALRKMVADTSVVGETAESVLSEFVQDIEAVGIDNTTEEWPDLADTYHRALKVLGRRPDQAQRHNAPNEI
jgi:hypothetical protein